MADRGEGNDKVLGEYRRPEKDRDFVQARSSEFKGKDYFSFRVWYRPENGEEGARRPSTNGINLTFDEREAFARLVAQALPQYLTFHEPIPAGSEPDA